MGHVVGCKERSNARPVQTDIGYHMSRRPGSCTSMHSIPAGWISTGLAATKQAEAELGTALAQDLLLLLLLGSLFLLFPANRPEQIRQTRSDQTPSTAHHQQVLIKQRPGLPAQGLPGLVRRDRATTVTQTAQLMWMLVHARTSLLQSS